MWQVPAADQVPYTIRPYNEALAWIERMGLSRAHKQLFLLIDGCRSITELVRLTGRGQEEVSALLRELESAGLIRQK
jgi:predicted transcriptional regulator